MADSTESIRREMVAEINSEPGSRESLEEQHGQVWTTSELQKDFEVLSFAAPFCVVKRREDDVRGTVTFRHDPRFFFGFKAEG